MSQLEILNKQYCGGGVLSFQLREFRFVLCRQSLGKECVNFAIIINKFSKSNNAKPNLSENRKYSPC